MYVDVQIRPVSQTWLRLLWFKCLSNFMYIVTCTFNTTVTMHVDNYYHWSKVAATRLTHAND